MPITLKNKAVHIDGVASFIFSAELIPYRLPSVLWRDRFEKLKAANLNAVGLYLAWNFHSPSRGIVDLTSPDRDVARLLDEAAVAGLKIIMRPGPYVCNEWDLGGYPNWLLKEDAGDWRTGDPKHLAFCREWFSQVNPILSQKQHGRGGSIILYQIENEHRWNDRDFLGGLADAAREDGIEVPFVGNHDGGGLVVTDKLADGTDIYTPPLEFFRWRGWLDGVNRRAGADVPLMVMEYRCGDHPFWGEAPASPNWPPPHWTISQDRLFAACGANVLNHFVGVGCLTPLGFNSDHVTTNYADYALITPWGELAERFYETRLLGGCIQSFNELFALARPFDTGWGTNNLFVECLGRRTGGAVFLFPINHANTPQEFVITLPDGSRWPRQGTLSIDSFRTQLLVADTHLAEGVILRFSPFQILQAWTDDQTTHLIVYGPDKAEQTLLLEVGGREEDVAVRCSSNVSIRTLESDGRKVIIYGVSRKVAERTWVVERNGKRIPLFGNLDLVRAQPLLDAPVSAEVRLGMPVNLIVPSDLHAFSINGRPAELKARGDGLSDVLISLPQPCAAEVSLGTAKVRLEPEWVDSPTDSGNWKNAVAYGPNAEILLAPGDYRWLKEFDIPRDRPLPEVLELLGISAVEITVMLNGRLLGVYPKQRIDSAVKNPSFNAVFDVRGIIQPGRNRLAVEMHFHGRHNSGQPIYAGFSQPAVLRSLERREQLVPAWKVSPEHPRKWRVSELDAVPEPALPGFQTDSWEEVDLSKPNLHRRPAENHSRHEVRWYRARIDIPESMRDRPLFIECPPVEEVWAYANGRCLGRTRAGTATCFDLSEFADREFVELTMAVRHNWFFFSSGIGFTGAPRLVAFDSLLDSAWLLSAGMEGPWRGEGAFEAARSVLASTDASEWLALQDCAGARRLWVRQKVTVRNPGGLIAPLFVELNGWTEHATLYWNGEALGLYASVGPQTRFHIHEGIVREENELLIAVDGYGKPAQIGSLTAGFYCQSIPLELRFSSGD